LVAICVVALGVYYVLLAPLTLFLCVREKRYRATLTAERQGEDIGTFARSFDRRSKHFDPWVIRATWDALMPYMDYPIRASDRLDDLGIDWDDIFFCIIPEVIERSGHVLEGPRTQPTHLERETVGDLVLWVASLNKRETDSTACAAG
jgi:hypothetical protein